MLYDRDFLLELDKCKNKAIYARITALTFNETPIQFIEGRVTQGSINIDGASAVRRTCSLSIVGQNFDYNDYYWGLNTKFKLEIGLQNYINDRYPEIIWFKQGIFIITNFSTARSTTSFTISISGKDKMCLLNGEVGGSLDSSIDFGKIEEAVKEEGSDEAIWVIREIPIPEIIRNMIHTYGGEPYHNIIINDLDTYGKELLEYRLDVPAYVYKIKDSNEPYNIFLDGKRNFIVYNNNNTKAKSKTAIENIPEDYFDLLIDSLMSNNKTYYFKEEENENSPKIIISKMGYGDTIGYRKTELTYPGDLIANIGESITSILDKIKNMLVEFEYFYDLDGRFVFQKKKSCVTTMWGPETPEEEQKPVSEYSLGNADYIFSGAELISAFNNAPNMLNIRNDFSIWGERTSVSGAKIPVHLRYAIDNKPTQYKSISILESDPQIVNYNNKFGTKVKGQTGQLYKVGAETKNYSKVTLTDSTFEINKYYYKRNGQFILEEKKYNENRQYYERTDITSDKYYWDWREVIFQMAKDYYQYNFLDDFELRVAEANPDLYPTGRTGYEQYYTDLQGFWRQLYNPEPEDDEKDNYYKCGSNQSFWNKTVFTQPYNLNFWFDLLDTEGELKQFGIKSIGARSKSIKDSNIKAIYFRETPNIEFGSDDSTTADIPISENQEYMFSISSQGKSAKERLDELLYEHGYCNETATINSIPIYYLEPNSRIYVNDPETKIIGYYIVNKISLPLTYNGTMTLNVTKSQDT